MKLYNVYAEDLYGDMNVYQVTTDNFEKWLKNHNKNRVADGNEPEKRDCFKVERTWIELFNDKKEDK